MTRLSHAITKLLLLFCLTAIHAIVINYPTACHTYQEVLYQGLECPEPAISYKLDNNETVAYGQICRPQLASKDILEGYLCYKDTYISSCEETWYFTSQVKQTIVHEHVSDAECIESLAYYKSGIVETPMFLNVDCYWNAINSIKKSYLIIVYHPVPFDPYTNSIKDAVVKNSEDVNSWIRDTHYPFTKWIRDFNGTAEEKCDAQHWECFKVNLYKGWIYSPPHTKNTIGSSTQTGLILESDIYSHTLIRDLCRFQFCGIHGFVFQDQSWWDLQLNVSLSSLISTEHLSGAPDGHCKKVNEIGHAELEPNWEKILSVDDYDIRHQLCLDTLASVLGGGFLTARDLLKFAPMRPGLGPAYFLFNPNKRERAVHVWTAGATTSSILWKSTCKYELIDIPQLNDTGIITYEKLDNIIGKILRNDVGVSFKDLGFTENELTDDDVSQSQLNSSLGIYHRNTSMKGIPWKRHRASTPKLKMGPNGILHDLNAKIIHLPQASSSVFKLPPHLYEGHRVVFFNHITKKKIYEDLSKREGNDPYNVDIGDLIGRHLNRTTIPDQLHDWVSGIKRHIFSVFEQFGSLIKVVVFIIMLVLCIKIINLIYRFYKVRKSNHKKLASRKEKLHLSDPFSVNSK
ncbi:G protein [Tibrovirus congo]|uniref:G protein n=1 Tax=Tibrovirus congo TaxID=1987017 RepID=K0A194_9RHAB|nr:G protein [Tibrovirus congo]AFS65336.1 G protein [Tibrovirus congo]